MEQFYSLFDCIISTSYTESFSNSIAEAMACECIPLVSDAGESKVIANFGQSYSYIFPPKDLQRFCAGLESVLYLEKDQLQIAKKNERFHILNNFFLVKMVKDNLEGLKK